MVFLPTHVNHRFRGSTSGVITARLVLPYPGSAGSLVGKHQQPAIHHEYQSRVSPYAVYIHSRGYRVIDLREMASPQATDRHSHGAQPF